MIYLKLKLNYPCRSIEFPIYFFVLYSYWLKQSLPLKVLSTIDFKIEKICKSCAKTDRQFYNSTFNKISCNKFNVHILNMSEFTKNTYVRVD